jgi:hypothetical protein
MHAIVVVHKMQRLALLTSQTSSAGRTAEAAKEVAADGKKVVPRPPEKGSSRTRATGKPLSPPEYNTSVDRTLGCPSSDRAGGT